MQLKGLCVRLAAGSLALALPLMANPPEKKGIPATKKETKATYGTFGMDLDGMDRTVAPGDDFGKFVNGTYLKNLEIPADRSDFGMFAKLRDLSQERTRGIVEAAAAVRKGAKPGSEEQKVGDFYASFMDEAAIEAKGLTPLKAHLDTIAAITERSQLARAFGQATRLGVGLPLGMGPMQDLKNPEVFAVYVGQGGLGMPDRDYYLDQKNPKFAEVRGKYLTHIAAMLRLAGLANPEARATGIFDLETKIAEVHWTRVQSRQIDKLYNPVKVADIATT